MNESPATTVPLKKFNRGIEQWRKRADVKLSYAQRKSLHSLYDSREQHSISNPFSLGSTLSIWPELRESYVPDWNVEDGQMNYPDLNSKPVLYLMATRESDPWL